MANEASLQNLQNLLQAVVQDVDVLYGTLLKRTVAAS